MPTDFPAGLTGRQTRTRFLRAPTGDWPVLSQGHKEEFRVPRKGMAVPWNAPTPVVLYTKSVHGIRTQLMVLVEHRVERLFEVGQNPDSLQREGFETYDHFISYWRAVHRKGYNPLQEVDVFRITQFAEGWLGQCGWELIKALYADYLPETLLRRGQC